MHIRRSKRSIEQRFFVNRAGIELENVRRANNNIPLDLKIAKFKAFINSYLTSI